MKDIHGIGAYGFLPYLSEDLVKQAKYAAIKSKAAKVAYLMTMGKDAKKPQVKEGVYEARGALKWISDQLDKEEQE